MPHIRNPIQYPISFLRTFPNLTLLMNSHPAVIHRFTKINSSIGVTDHALTSDSILIGPLSTIQNSAFGIDLSSTVPFYHPVIIPKWRFSIDFRIPILSGRPRNRLPVWSGRSRNQLQALMAIAYVLHGNFLYMMSEVSP